MSAVLKEKEVVLLPSFVLDEVNLYLKSTQGSLWQQGVLVGLWWQHTECLS